MFAKRTWTGLDDKRQASLLRDSMRALDHRGGDKILALCLCSASFVGTWGPREL